MTAVKKPPAAAQRAAPAKKTGPGKAKVHAVPTSIPAPVLGKAYRRRRFWTWVSLVPMVLLPVLFSVIYLFHFAADRYVVESRFAVRSPSGFAATDLMGMVTGVSAAGSTALDSYMLIDYIESGEMVSALERRIDLRAIYDTPKADFLMRFDSTGSKEDFARYFGWMHKAYYDTTSQVITLEVQAFTPEEAKLVAEQILALCNDLVNEVSEQARQDTVHTAEQEVARAEEQLRQQRRALATFREEGQVIDPSADVGTQQVLMGEIESQLAAARSELASMLEFLSPDSPQVKIRLSQIAALSAQLDDQRQKLGSGSDDGTGIGAATNLTTQVGAYEELSVDIEFRQRAYLSALASLEAARLEADRQQRYVATFVDPSLPEDAERPRPVLGVVLTLLGALILWGLVTMSVFIVREHTI